MRRRCNLILRHHGPNGNGLPNLGMQERRAGGTGRTAALRFALHPGAGNELLRNAPGNGPGERLARVATSGLHLTDDLKARILSTFLTLMNLRENLDRSSMRSSFGRSGHPR